MLSRVRQGVRPLVSKLLFERRLEVETSGRRETDELGYSDPRLVFYEPAEWLTLQRGLRRQPVGEDDVFLDLGSGMGRMVLRAAQLPFKRVIGVELSPELDAVARRNVARNRERLKCKDIELVLGDVRDYEVPDDVTVVFMNNPFTGEVFESAVQAVFASLDRRPRPITLVYRHPTEHERLMASGRARLVRQWQKGAWRRAGHGVQIRTYELLPFLASLPEL